MNSNYPPPCPDPGCQHGACVYSWQRLAEAQEHLPLWINCPLEFTKVPTTPYCLPLPKVKCHLPFVIGVVLSLLGPCL